MLPRHTASGLLPAGIHTATWADVVTAFGGSARRQRLLAGLHAVLMHLAEAGCQRAWLAGSFVSAKATPGDVDLVWDVEGVNPDDLNTVFLGPAGLPVLKASFGVDCYPSHLIEGLSGVPFVEFFQNDTRTGVPRGVVEVDLSTLEG
jgi:hypothetical protein